MWLKYEIQIIASQFVYEISSLHNTDITTHPYDVLPSSAYSVAIFDFRFSEFWGFLAVFQQFRDN